MNTTEKPATRQKLADFQPFTGWRYDASKVCMDDVIAPPYDVISPSEQDGFYARSPINVIRLILNKIEPTDTESNNRYTRSKAVFEAWQKEGVLIREKQPCYYYYLQTYKHPLENRELKRSALLGRIRLEPFDKGIIIPHEKTLPKARTDRRLLLEATKTNFSPVFGLYEDKKGDVASVFPEIRKAKPLFGARDNAGILHELWAVSDPVIIEKIHTSMAARHIYIADGHHRYTTSLEYGQIQREKAGNPAGDLASDFVLIALVEFDDPGLILLPTHRLVLPFEGFELDKAFRTLEPYFKLEPMPVDTLRARLKAPAAAGPTEFGLLLEDGRSFLAQFTGVDAAKKLMPAGKPEFWYHLDVNILSHLVFSKLWNLHEGILESALKFSRYDDEAVKAAQNGTARAVWMLRAPHVEMLRDMGQAKEILPQKSTYFHPKLASGLVFHSHQA